MDPTEIEEIFSDLGEVKIKRLFSGHGVYHQGLIVGAIMGGDVLLKIDAVTEPAFLAAGATQWTYTYPAGNTIRMPYYTMPADALDDPDQRAAWVRLAFDAARRSIAKTRKKSDRRRPSDTRRPTGA